MSRKGRVVALVLLTGACATGGEGGIGEATSEDVAVQAAALRWMVENNDSALRSSANAYCVGIGTGPVVGEPSPALIRELRGILPPVQPISRCAWAGDAAVGRRVVDELSEAPALALLVDLPEYEGTDAARVWAEYLERPGLGGGYDCRMTRGAAGWEVVDCDRRLPR